MNNHFRNITITLLASAGLSQTTTGQIAGCSNEIPSGFAAVAELRHDDGGGPDYLVTAGVNSSQQVEVVHANRYQNVAPMLITHICIYTENPDGQAPGAQSMTVFIANGDDTSFGDIRPDTYVWLSAETIQVGWQLVEVNPPVFASAVTWIGARFPTATATNPHMGVTAHTDYEPDGVTPTPYQSFVGILNFAGGQDIWNDYEDIPTGGFQGYRAILRGLTVDVTNCNNAGIVVGNAQNLETTEAGGQALFDVALTGPPLTENVLVLVSSTDLSEGDVNTIALIFTPANAQVPQPVIITGQDDPFLDGDQPYAIELLTSSLDQCYHAIPGPSVPVVNLDDEIANCPEDINGDLVVDVLDFLEVLANWDGIGPADVNGDGVIGVMDFLAVLAAWGPC